MLKIRLEMIHSQNLNDNFAKLVKNGVIYGYLLYVTKFGNISPRITKSIRIVNKDDIVLCE